MKNKKVIIITRDGEYPVDCVAYEKYSKEPNSECKSHLHEHIGKYIEYCYDKYSDDLSNAKKYWNPIARTGILPTYEQIYDDDQNLTNYSTYSNTTDEPEEPKTWFKQKLEIVNKINGALKVKKNPQKNEVDNRPYIHFTYNNFDVYFVFLNRILDSFVSGSNEYGFFINERIKAYAVLDFIKSICQDCGLVGQNGQLNKGEEKAILYIHDREWYFSGKPYSVLLNNRFIEDTQELDSIEKLDPTVKQVLGKYFSTIKVFLHNGNHIFNEIKRLDFTEDDRELAILERKYY